MQTLRSLALTLTLSCLASTACDGRRAACAGPRSDVEFIDAMVPHHEMAVEMSRRELADGVDAGARKLAQGIVDAQIAEIAQMKAVRAELTGSDAVPEGHDPRLEADMQALSAVSGAALDRLFVADMLPHHAGAITMSHEALPHLKRADLRALAEKIIRAQAAEIGALGAMLGPAGGS